MLTESSTKTEQQARRLRWSAWVVLIGGFVLSILAWWQASKPGDTPTQALTLLACGAMISALLCRLLHITARRHFAAGQAAEALHQQVRQSEMRLRTVVDHTEEGILTLDTQGVILGANEAIARLFGHPIEALKGQHLSTLLPAASETEHNPQALENFFQLQHMGLDGVGRRTEGLRANGHRFPLGASLTTMVWQGQNQHICMLRDLSAQETTERAILAAQRQLNEVDEMRRVIVHNAPYAVFVLNSQGVFQTVNPAGERLLGSSAVELVGREALQNFFDVNQVSERAHLLSMRSTHAISERNVIPYLAKESPGMPSEWLLVRSDGASLIAEVIVTELSNEYGAHSGYLFMAHDVTARHQAEHQLQHVALHDALTSLPNRNMLQEQLKTCLSIAQREQDHLAMILIDVDRFKKINDTLGHHIGDSVLVEISRRLRTAMRTSDIVARLGGDEFMVLLPRISALADGEVVAAKVHEIFQEPVRVGEHELRLTASIGLAIYPDHGADAATLMRHADLAMYQAKNDGRNRIQVFSERMAAPSAASLLLENELYHAQERQELRLHFQPQFDCRTGRLTGAEALMRWEHGGRLVPPTDFIPLAEESGLIVSLGEWALREACTVAHRWRQNTGHPLRIAVNLSAVQLEHPGLVETVSRVLADTGLPATALELEITESVVVRESLRAADILRQLRALGISIAIDDFGVGYSSFAYLRELPVDRFKLDRSFLIGVPLSNGDSRLVAALIAMGHRLEVGIVAEGVETAEQAAFLRDHGCDEAQGYHLGHPVKEADFEKLLQSHL